MNDERNSADMAIQHMENDEYKTVKKILRKGKKHNIKLISINHFDPLFKDFNLNCWLKHLVERITWT